MAETLTTYYPTLEETAVQAWLFKALQPFKAGSISVPVIASRDNSPRPNAPYATFLITAFNKVGYREPITREVDGVIRYGKRQTKEGVVSVSLFGLKANHMMDMITENWDLPSLLEFNRANNLVVVLNETAHTFNVSKENFNFFPQAVCSFRFRVFVETFEAVEIVESLDVSLADGELKDKIGELEFEVP